MKRPKNRAARRQILLRRNATAASALVLAISTAYGQQSGQSGAALPEIIVTAQKREESLQNVPISIQALGGEQLESLNVSDFEDYVKFLPSVSYTAGGPGFNNPYFRGVANGENSNHSGPQPSVGIYLDEHPITMIQGSLDINIYDVARVESLAGPQGTLYGASSQAGTIRIITNKPDTSGFAAGYDLEVNTVKDGDPGYSAEGFINLPISEMAAIRLVGWYREDGGYIDNVPVTRTFATSGACISNASPPAPGCIGTRAQAKEDYNDVTTYGGRAALRLELGDNWAITPSVVAQKQEYDGNFVYNPKLGDLKIGRFYPEYTEDKFYQAALTVEGDISNFELVYAGSYLDRDDVVESDYSDYAYFYDVLAGYGAYWTDDTNTPLANPSQYINGSDRYRRQTHELRLTSPADQPLRFVVGAYFGDTYHAIFQRYLIDGLGDSISVTNWPDTIWLTNQTRKYNELAAFGEVSYDFTEQFTATVGARAFRTEDEIRGFFGFSENYSGNYGEAKCLGVGRGTDQLRGSPCTSSDVKVTERDEVYKVNLTYRFDDNRLIYATYSEGYRPGGINRNTEVGPYEADVLTNREVGWKTTLADGAVRFNGAVFVEDWDDVQFSFLPPSGSGLTVVRNAGDATINGIEADIDWQATEGLRIGGGFSFVDADLEDDYRGSLPSDPTVTAPAGTQLPVTPPFKANLTARYEFPLAALDGFVQASGIYSDSRWSALEEGDRQVLGKLDSYWLADMSAGVSWDSMSVEIFVNNVFDERADQDHWVACNTQVCAADVPTVVYDGPGIYVNRPRTIGLKFGQKFGSRD